MGRGVKGKYKAENFKGEATELAELENAAMMAGEDNAVVELDETIANSTFLPHFTLSPSMRKVSFL